MKYHLVREGKIHVFPLRRSSAFTVSLRFAFRIKRVISKELLRQQITLIGKSAFYLCPIRSCKVRSRSTLGWGGGMQSSKSVNEFSNVHPPFQNILVECLPACGIVYLGISVRRDLGITVGRAPCGCAHSLSPYCTVPGHVKSSSHPSAQASGHVPPSSVREASILWRISRFLFFPLMNLK